MLKRTCISVLAVLSLLPVAAFADGTVTLTLSSPSDGQNVSGGDPISWTITAVVSPGDNLGLALISADLLQDEANPELIDLPQADSPPTEMLGFARPGGVANPAGYEGTQVGASGEMNLAQVGGGQNVFGQVGPPGIGQDVNVDSGVGQGPSGQVIATGSFNAPATEGTYTFLLDDPVANVLETVEPPGTPSTVSEPAVVIDVGSFSFTVGAACCPCVGDLSDPCDNVRNVTDFTIFATAFGSFCGDPDYNECADFDSNCTVNVTDFTTFAAGFGVACP